MKARIQDQLPQRIREAVRLAGGPKAVSRRATNAVSESALTHYMSGANRPGVDTVVAIADLAGISIEWLAAGRGERERAKPIAPIPVFRPDDRVKGLALLDQLRLLILNEGREDRS